MKYCLPFAIFISLNFAIAAKEIPGHPIMSQIIKGSESQLHGPCSVIFEYEYSLIAIKEKKEVAFLANDRKSGICQIQFLSGGETNGVEIPFDTIKEALAQNENQHIASIHTHPLNNVDYFKKGVSYSNQIMFAGQKDIATYSLDPKIYEELISLTKNKMVPGFSLSPPSIHDFIFLIERSSTKEILDQGILDPVVITSGGKWSYILTDFKKKTVVRKKLEAIVFYANIYEMANSEGSRRSRASDLLQMSMKDPETKDLITRWQHASLELRRPYSLKAILAYKNNNSSLIYQEYKEKVEVAEDFSKLLKSIGIETSFTPFW